MAVRGFRWKPLAIARGGGHVNPLNTSKTCSKCKSLNTEFRERILICKN